MRIGPFGVWEILIILIVVLLIFGPRRLPEMAKGLGQSVRAFRKEMRDFKDDLAADERPSAARSDRTEPPPAQAAPASQAGESAKLVEPPVPPVHDEPDSKPA